MCVLSIKLPIRKNSGNLSYAPRKSDFLSHPVNVEALDKLVPRGLNKIFDSDSSDD